MYVPSPFITIVRPWFATIGYRGEIGAKGTLKKSCLPPRWRLLMAQTILNKKTREKIVPYLRFLSLLLEHIMPEYENEKLTINPTQVFSVHNLTLNPNQHEEPSFTDHMKAICNLDVPIFFYLHSESASGHDALVDSTTKADLGIYAPKDSIS
ncbi:hypothetical protein Tco_1308739 [Tanacetum coccineum]